MTDEPGPAAAGSGSSSSADRPALDELPRPSRWVLRLAIAAVLAVAAAGSASSFLVVGPFVPALVALGLLRGHRWRGAAVAAGAAAACTAAVLLAGGRPTWIVTVAAAVPLWLFLLGREHARAARPDPDLVDEAWPEPRLDTGFARVLWMWLLVAVTVVAIPVATSVGSDGARDGSRAAVRASYADYERACAGGGALADSDAICEAVHEQRQQLLDITDHHAPSLLAALAAFLVATSAGIAHTVVLGRGRALAAATRRPRPLRELEFHWSVAYVLAIGLVLVMSADAVGASAAASEWIRAGGVGLATVGGLLVFLQGVGLTAWLLRRRPLPRWYRVILVIALLTILPAFTLCVFAFGVLDLAIHPRRRSDSLPGRSPGR